MSTPLHIPRHRLRRVRLTLHDTTCLRGRWCLERRRHARLTCDARARQLLACATVGDALAVLHDWECRRQIMRIVYPDGCDRTREHAREIRATSRTARLLRACELT